MDNKYFIQLIWVFYQFVYLSLVFPIYCFALFVKPRKQRWIFGAQRGHAFSDNAKHLYLYVHEKENMTAVWLTRSKAIVEDLTSKGYNAYYFYSLAGLYYCMSSSVAVVTHMGNNMRGDLPFFALNRKASIVQLWHGIPLKKIGFDDKLFSQKKHLPFVQFIKEKAYGLFPYASRIQSPSAVLALSIESKKLFSSAFRVSEEKIFITGYPRNDLIYENMMPTCLSAAKKVIFMPTFRGCEGASLDPLSDFNFNATIFDPILEKNNLELYIKLHPFNLPSNDLIKQIDDSNYIHFLDCEDIYEHINQFDILITDYSSIFFDFLLLDRPIIFTPFDHETYLTKDRELYYDYDKVTPGPKAYNWVEVFELLLNIDVIYNNYKLQRQNIRDLFHTYQDGESRKRVYELICGLADQV